MAAISELARVATALAVPNGILKRGGRRDRLEAKIFGGAKTIASFSNVGEQNATFATQFLRDEGIAIVGSSTGGEFG